MNASYTPIVRSPALTVGVFTPPAGGKPAKGQAHQLQNRDKHRRARKNALAYLK